MDKLATETHGIAEGRDGVVDTYMLGEQGKNEDRLHAPAGVGVTSGRSVLEGNGVVDTDHGCMTIRRRWGSCASSTIGWWSSGSGWRGDRGSWLAASSRANPCAWVGQALSHAE